MTSSFPLYAEHLGTALGKVVGGGREVRSRRPERQGLCIDERRP